MCILNTDISCHMHMLLNLLLTIQRMFLTLPPNWYVLYIAMIEAILLQLT